MATGFVDRKGVLVVELINPGAPITSQMYWDSYSRSSQSTSGVVLLLGTARPPPYCKQLKWKPLDHPPSFGPRPYRLSTVPPPRNVPSTARTHAHTAFYDEGIQKLEPLYDTCPLPLTIQKNNVTHYLIFDYTKISLQCLQFFFGQPALTCWSTFLIPTLCKYTCLFPPHVCGNSALRLFSAWITSTEILVFCFCKCAWLYYF